MKIMPCSLSSFAVPRGQSPVHVALDVAVLLELDEGLDFLVEVILVPGIHRDDVPAAREGRFRRLLRPWHWSPPGNRAHFRWPVYCRSTAEETIRHQPP